MRTASGGVGSAAGGGIRPVTFIDWSDAEGMFGMFVELVADETADCRDDPERLRFLADLLAGLRSLEDELPEIPVAAAVRSLQELRESADPGFADDPVTVHLDDLIAELDGIGTS